MSLPTVRAIREPYALTIEIAGETRGIVRAAMDRATPRLSASALAARLGVDSSRLDAWFKTAHVPLYVIRHPAMPLATSLGIVADLLAARVAEARSGRTVESSTGMLIETAGRLLAIAGRSLADGRVDDTERVELETLIAELRDYCNRWLSEHSRARTLAVVDGGTR